MKIEQAMILAAGLGKRMQPLTNDRPKPMIVIKGKPIIDYAIDQLRDNGVTTIVANTHYKSEILNPHLKSKDVIISPEPTLLDTGGGIKKALTHFDIDKPLLVLSGDSILMGNAGIKDLIAAWNEKTMDILLLLQPLATMTITPGVGDYTIKNNKPVRTPDHNGQYMWTSARIFNPKILDKVANGTFSFLPLIDAAESNHRLGAVIHTGTWHHLTTPKDVERVNAT